MKKKNTTTRLTCIAVLTAFVVFGSTAAHGSGVLMQLYFDGTNTCTYLSGRLYSSDALNEKMTKTIEAIPGAGGLRIHVKVFPNVPFQDVVSAVDIVQNAGFTNVVVEMRKFGIDFSSPKVSLYLGKPSQSGINDLESMPEGANGANDSNPISIP